MKGAGEKIPPVAVWRAPNERVRLDALAGDGPFLLLFYVLDWTGV